MKDKDSLKYYPQIALEKCVYRPCFDNALIDTKLKFPDNEPDTEADYELEFNEDTV